MSTVLLLLPAVLLAPVPKDFAAQLQWKLAKGDVFYVTAEDRSAGTATVKLGVGGNQATEQETDTTTTFKYEVVSAEASARVVKVTCLRLDVVAKVAGQVAPATSADVAGATATLTFDAQFNVTKAELSAAFKDKLAGKSLGTFGGQTEQGLVEAVRQVFAVVPPKGVNGGEKWEQKTSLPMGAAGRLSRTAQCTAAELRDGSGHAVIATVAEYAWAAPTDDEKKQDAVSPFHVASADLKAEKCKGTVTFDPKRGRLVASTETIPMAGTISLQLDKQTFDVTMNLTLTRKLTVSDKPPARK